MSLPGAFKNADMGFSPLAVLLACMGAIDRPVKGCRGPQQATSKDEQQHATMSQDEQQHAASQDG